MADDKKAAGSEQEAADAPAAVTAPAKADPAATAPESPAGVEPEPVAWSAVDQLVQDWAYANLAGGPIGRDTECWNALMAALPILRADLQKGA